MRALGAAKDQNPRRTSNPLRRDVEELRTNRIACNKPLPSEEADGRLERHRGVADDPREQTVRESWNRVLLEEQRGDPPRGGGEHDRPRAVPATPMTTSGERRERMRQASTPLSGRSERPRSRAWSDVDLRPALRRTSSENPSRGMTRDSIPGRPGEGHDCVRLPAQHFPRDGNPGKEMAAGSTAGDENAQRFHASDGDVDTATA